MSFSRRALIKATAASAALGGFFAPMVARARVAEFSRKYADNLLAPPPMSARSKAELATLASLPANYFLENFARRADHSALITTVASFPANYFLENLALRSDNSALVTAMNKKELWYAPPAAATETVTPILLHTFEQLAWSFTEVEPDVFYLITSNVYTDHVSSLHRIDLRTWNPGEAIQPQKVLDFPKEARFLNGSCLIGPRTILVADSVAGLIWRVDLPKYGGAPSTRVWLRHESMENYPGQMQPEQPGINGVRYTARLGYVYYSGCAKKLFMRVKVNPETLDAIGEPEHVAVGRMYDDFCIDENAGVAYLMTHRENTIDCASLNPAKNSCRFIVAGDPLNTDMIGTTSAAWSRLLGEFGRVAFVTSDGGTASPLPDGVRRPAKLLRVELPEPPAPSIVAFTLEDLAVHP
jgi:hypothetical protein